MSRRALRDWLARRSPLERAIVFVYFARVAAGYVVALPVARAVAETNVFALPNGNRALFEPGGLWLFELLFQASTAILAGAKSALVLSVFALLLLSIPSAWLFSAVMSHAPGSLRQIIWLAPRFAAIGAAQTVVVAFLLAPTVLVASVIGGWVAPASTERTSDLMAFGVLGLGVALAVLLTVLTDLTRAALAQSPTRIALAVTLAIKTFRTGKGQLLGGYVLASGLGVLWIAIASRLTQLAGIEEAGLMRLLLVILIHQSALLGLVFIEAGWISRLSAVLKSRVEPVQPTPGSALRR